VALAHHVVPWLESIPGASGPTNKGVGAPMKALIVYDSVFGNTAQVAQTLAAALETAVLPANQVTPETLSGLGQTNCPAE